MIDSDMYHQQNTPNGLLRFNSKMVKRTHHDVTL
jgi:hypothetical protein